MIGTRTGDDEPHAVFTHCYAHSLNLTASDTVKRPKLWKQHSRLQNSSSAHKGALQLSRSYRLKMTLYRKTKLLVCPTHWTVPVDFLLSIIENYLLK